MNIHINGQPIDLAERATVADAIAALKPAPPFAVAVNREFVPRGSYAIRPLQAGDQVEVIRPVTGG